MVTTCIQNKTTDMTVLSFDIDLMVVIGIYFQQISIYNVEYEY